MNRLGTVVHHRRDNRYFGRRSNSGDPVLPLSDRLAGARGREANHQLRLLLKLPDDIGHQAIGTGAINGYAPQNTYNATQREPEDRVLNEK